MEFQADVDARELKCPFPILQAKKALAKLESGQVLRIVATDPASVRDFQVFTQQTGNELLASQEENAEYTFLIRRR